MPSRCTAIIKIPQILNFTSQLLEARLIPLLRF